MEEKQICKWLRRRFTQVGWTLIVYYVIMNVLAVLAMAGEGLRQTLRSVQEGSFTDVDMNAVAGNAWGYILTIAVGLVILYAWKGGDYWREELLAKQGRMEGAAFFWLLCLCMGIQMVNGLWIGLLETILNQFGLSAMAMMENVSGASDTVSMFLYASLLAPVAEELLFRGYVLRTLRPFGKRFAVFGSAFLFGIFHGNLLQTPYAFLMGLVLGYVTVEYSVFWAMALHMFNNLVLADLLTRLMEPLPETVATGIQLLLFGGAALASLVVLIVKREQVRAYRGSEWMDRRCLKCFFTCSGVLLLTGIMAANMVLLLFV